MANNPTELDVSALYALGKRLEALFFLRRAFSDDELHMVTRAAAEIERLREEDRQWDKASLVEIIKERDRLRAELEHRERYWAQFDHVPKSALDVPNEPAGGCIHCGDDH